MLAIKILFAKLKNHVFESSRKNWPVIGNKILTGLDQINLNIPQPFIAKANQANLEVASNGYVVYKTTKLPANSVNATINYGFLDYGDVPDNELAYNPATSGSAPVKNPKQ